MLIALLLIPLLAAVAVMLTPRAHRDLPRMIAVLAGAMTAGVGVLAFVQFNPADGMNYLVKIPWVASLGLYLHLGADGLNIGLLLMGSIVAYAASMASWGIEKLHKEFYALLLLMTAGILGAFASQDLFWFYFFHELALVPTFIMIGVWGTGMDKAYAAFQITLYLTAGALVALAGLILLYVKMPAGARTFDIGAMTAFFQANPLPASDQILIFGLLLFGFGVLVSLWPFHTWAPLGYASAPASNAMLHAGVLKKFGLYGLLKVALPMLPLGAQKWLPILALLCLGNLLYCGWVAMRQRDLNLLIGNSSVAHMGFCFLGIASFTVAGLTGAVLVMVAHGFLAALSYALTGWLRQQAGTLEMDKLGGLLQRMPFVGTCLAMAMLAGCGVPGFANFAGELMVLFGAWKSQFAPAWITVCAAWGALVIGGVYMLRAIRSVLHGPLPATASGYADVAQAAKLPFVILLACLLVFGVRPGLLTSLVEPEAARLVQAASVKTARAPSLEPASHLMANSQPVAAP
ncbi:MAG: NADH-quinone oxidoreductase subunit M [Verrucomicrobia bacterium]|nr:NADH-quinone oxidoreductase subunit M [Verrucomicrobiota bacterium]